MLACEKHRALPVHGYSPCPGCEIEYLRAENRRLRAALEPFAAAFAPERPAYAGQDALTIESFDRNTITPQVTMGVFRRAWEAMTGRRALESSGQ